MGGFLSPKLTLQLYHPDVQSLWQFVNRLHTGLLWKTEKVLFWHLSMPMSSLFVGPLLEIWTCGLTQRMALLGSLPIRILLRPQNLLHNLASYQVLSRHSHSSGERMWHFKLYTPKNGLSNSISYDSGHSPEYDWFSHRIKEKSCVFSHYFLPVDEFTQCIKSHLVALCYVLTGCTCNDTQ